MLKSNPTDFIRLQMKLMKFLGLWPQEKPTILYTIKKIIVSAIPLGFIFAMVAELINCYGNWSCMSDMSSILLPPLTYFGKLFVFYIKRDKFLKLYALINNNIFQQYPNMLDIHLKKAIKNCNNVGKLYQSFCAFNVIIYCLRPLLSPNLTLPIRFSFNLGDYHYLMYFYLSISIAFCASNNSSLDMLAVSILAFVSSQFLLVSEKVRNCRRWAGLTEEQINNGMVVDSEEIIKEIDYDTAVNLRKCIKHHIAIYRLVKNIEDVFSIFFLLQFLSSVVHICFMALDMSHASLMSIQFLLMLNFLWTMTLQISMYCWYGNKIIIKSSHVKDASYNADWLYSGPEVRKILIIIMERAKRPSYITAGKFSVLSLASLVKILQTSYSYFAVMQNFYKDKQ